MPELLHKQQHPSWSTTSTLVHATPIQRAALHSTTQHLLLELPERRLFPVYFDLGLLEQRLPQLGGPLLALLLSERVYVGDQRCLLLWGGFGRCRGLLGGWRGPDRGRDGGKARARRGGRGPRSVCNVKYKGVLMTRVWFL